MSRLRESHDFACNTIDTEKSANLDLYSDLEDIRGRSILRDKAGHIGFPTLDRLKWCPVTEGSQLGVVHLGCSMGCQEAGYIGKGPTYAFRHQNHPRVFHSASPAL